MNLVHKKLLIIYILIYKPEKTYVCIMRCKMNVLLCEIYKYMVIGLKVRYRDVWL
jgi:hypothetical protein